MSAAPAAPADASGAPLDVARARWVIDHTPVPAAVVDEAGRLLRINGPWRHAVDGMAAEVGAPAASAFVEPAAWEQLLAQAGDHAAESEGVPLRVCRADGAHQPVRAHLLPWVDGTQQGAVVFLERSAALHSEALLSSVLASSLDGIMAFEAVRDASATIVDFVWVLANPAAERMTERQAADLLGRRLLEEMPGNKDEGLFDAYVRVVETGEPFERELFYGHDRIERAFKITAVPLGDGFAVTFRDVTEDRRAEQRLRRSKERYRLLADNITDLVCLYDAEGRYLYVSPSARRILGFTPDEMQAMDPADLVYADDLSHAREAYREAREGGRHTRTTVRVRTKEGAHRWLETTYRPLTNEAAEGARLLTTSRDVTERVQAEQEASQAAAALVQRNRELQDFAYVASHDLQEPLRKIRAFADLIEGEHGRQLGPEGQDYLRRMQDAAGRMSKLISDLLAFSRITTRAQPFEPVALATIVEHVLADLELAIQESGATIDVGDLCSVEADSTQMRQLLQNLIANAIKFRRPDAAPRIRIEARSIEDALPGPVHARDACQIIVADDGIGFDEKYLDRIFTPFQRLHGRGTYAGTGMGLAICRRIAERHGGAITAESAPGAGSRFIVLLPEQQPAVTEASPAAEVGA